MQIQFLGTGGPEWGEEAQDAVERQRAVRARELGGKSIRRPAMLFVRPDTVIDFPATAAEQMAAFGVDPRQIRNILITHSHGDHFDPHLLIQQCQGQNHVTHIYGNRHVGEAITQALTEVQPNVALCFHCLDGMIGHEYPVGDKHLIPLRANHITVWAYSMARNETALNYILRMDDEHLLYALDASWMLPETYQIVKRYRYDIVIMDGHFGVWELSSYVEPSTCPLQSLEIAHHSTFSMVAEMLNQFREDRLIDDRSHCLVSHVSILSVPPHEETAAMLSEKGITLPYDGLTIST